MWRRDWPLADQTDRLVRVCLLNYLVGLFDRTTRSLSRDSGYSLNEIYRYI
jgi:hypothetical protein